MSEGTTTVIGTLYLHILFPILPCVLFVGSYPFSLLPPFPQLITCMGKHFLIYVEN